MTNRQAMERVLKLADLGAQVLDVKADIHEDVEKYMDSCINGNEINPILGQTILEDMCEIVDKHFEKIER